MRPVSPFSVPMSQSDLATRTAGVSSPAIDPANAGIRLRPLQVTWEMTQACEWKPALARSKSQLREWTSFSTAEAFHLIDEVAAMHVPLLTLTGGDPLVRPDLFPIVEFASRRSVRTSLTLLATPKLEPAIIGELKSCGLLRVGFWLHASTPTLDDSHWGISGLHRRTLGILGTCHEEQLPVQVNTIVSRRNFQDIDALIELLIRLDVVLWNVFFFVPASRDNAALMLSADEHEDIFAKLYAASKRVHFQIRTNEGQPYQRYALQQRLRESRRSLKETDVDSAPRGLNDSRGFVFINHQGEACPSRYLPLSGGNVTKEPLSRIYRESSLFVSLRDSSRLKGKCGRCPVRNVCGGSRARAYVMTGDLFGPDPGCAFEP